MKENKYIFKTEQYNKKSSFTISDIIVFIFISILIYGGIKMAISSPEIIKGEEISLSPSRLPYYAFLSVMRMLAAYLLSIIFSLFYGYMAYKNRYAEKVLMPLLDVLQSIPILSFLPVTLLSFSVIFPEKISSELASIVLIFTGQAWNITFSWYQSLNTLPHELKEASSIFGFNWWLRFKTLELPFGTISLIWNSMMSWAGGWFFLMAAEMFSVGDRDFRLQGLGSYLQEGALQGDSRAILYGIITLILVIIILDQLVWRPLLSWSEKFKMSMTESENPPESWFYDILLDSQIIKRVKYSLSFFSEKLNNLLSSGGGGKISSDKSKKSVIIYIIVIIFLVFLLYGFYRTVQMLFSVPLDSFVFIFISAGATLLRVMAALIIALLWTVPLGVFIGTNKRASSYLQPVIQVIASIPATAVFPLIIIAVLNLPGGINIAAVLLMLMGTQWYLLFNIIAGASSIPQDLKYTAELLRLNTIEKWRTLILPSLFPYIITGAITAAGGAWNASIVAEYIEFDGKAYITTGIGALINKSTAEGNYPLLLASTLSMVITVVLINRIFWKPLYRLSEEKYRME
jgi:NitT/TauT family transport system permease protein